MHEEAPSPEPARRAARPLGDQVLERALTLRGVHGDTVVGAGHRGPQVGPPRPLFFLILGLGFHKIGDFVALGFRIWGKLRVLI